MSLTKEQINEKTVTLFEKIMDYSPIDEKGLIDIDIVKIQLEWVKYMNKLLEEGEVKDPVIDPLVNEDNITEESSNNIMEIAKKTSEELKKQKLE